MGAAVFPKAKAEKSHTRCGTPVSPAWDEDWTALVEATELRLSRRICGARTIDGEPCGLFSDHESGRCRFHGGHEQSGARAGNRNAMLHGLFVRRLQDCGTHCARFERCPLAGSDVAELPATQRPACPYELAEYELSVEDLAPHAEKLVPVGDYSNQYAHQVVLVQVMIGRAARAVAASGSDATFGAFLRLSSEYRRALRRMAAAPARDREAEKAKAADLALVRKSPVLQDLLEHERIRAEARRGILAHAGDGD